MGCQRVQRFLFPRWARTHFASIFRNALDLFTLSLPLARHVLHGVWSCETSTKYPRLARGNFIPILKITRDELPMDSPLCPLYSLLLSALYFWSFFDYKLKPRSSSWRRDSTSILYISQFHLRPAPPPPRATARHLPALSVPGVGHLQIFHCPGAGHLPTPGHSRAFDTHSASHRNITTKTVLLEKKQIGSSVKDRIKL